MQGEAALMDRLVADHAEVKAWGTKTILRGAAPAPGGGGIVWCLEEGHYLMGSMEGYASQFNYGLSPVLDLWRSPSLRDG